tara:strand:- start:149 stop:895 length:747 start_codon:yes stop_codon:yes gene_type:complete
MYNLILNTDWNKQYVFQANNIETIKGSDLNHYIEKKTHINSKYFNLYYGSQNIKSEHFLSDYNLENGSIININIAIKGGDVFSSIANAVAAVADFCIVTVPFFFLDLLKIVYWILKLFLWVVTDILNPVVWVEDGAKGIFNVIIIIIMGIIEIVLGLIRVVFNYTLEPIFSSFWGHGKNNKVGKCKKCFSTRAGKLPFSVIIGTILLPPLGVFMELGISGWINIVVCVLLTLAFYFPGLIYALILLTC